MKVLVVAFKFLIVMIMLVSHSICFVLKSVVAFEVKSVVALLSNKHENISQL